MQRKHVFAWGIGITLAFAAAGSAWAQDTPEAPKQQPAGTAADASANEPAVTGDFEGAEDMMESSALGGGAGTGTGTGTSTKPWAAGVSDADKAKAQALFKEGNDYLRESLFPQAVKKYREALELWDHPGIHFNLALALMNLEQPIAVYRSLEKAMQYGEEALDKEKLERAQRYFDLVSEQLGTVEITVNEPGAKVTLDGKLVLTGPGTYRNLVLVGEHQVVASKPEYMDVKRDLVIEAKEQERLDLVMYTVAEMTVSKRRWTAWKPWAVVGAGAFVLAAGGGLHAQSKSSFESYDKSFDQTCMMGCTDEENRSLANKRESAELQQTIAVTSYIVGGTAAVAGLVLVFANRPQVFRRDIEAGTERQLTIVPVLTPDSAGVSAAFRF